MYYRIAVVQKILLASVLVFGRQDVFYARAQCPTETSVDILIVGAGMSGASAAAVLTEKQAALGFSWAWVEASDYAGGRMRDTEFGTQDVRIELGANWIQGGAGNPVYDLAVAAGIGAFVQDFDDIITINNGAVVDDSTMNWAAFDEAYICMQRFAETAFVENRTEDLQEISLRAQLQACNWFPLGFPTDNLDKVIEWYSIDYETSLIAESSSLFGSFPQYTYIFYEDVDYLVTDQTTGFNGIVDYMINTLISKQPYYNVRVTNIDTQNSNGAVVSMQNGQTACTPITAKRVISTLSVGVLDTVTDLFTPPFPSDKKAAMNKVYEMGLYYKFFFEFTRESWDNTFSSNGYDGYEFIQIANAFGSACHHWQNLDVGEFFLPDSYIMFCTMTTETIQDLNIDVLDEAALYAVTFGPLEEVFDTLVIADFYYEDWANDDLTYGSYEMWKTEGLWSDYETFKAPILYSNSNENAVFISGSARCGNFFGYTHGAYEAGNLTANLVLADLGYATSWSLICDYIIGWRNETEWEWEYE